MIAYPIIFSAPMVRALLDGRKTQTRRVAEVFVPAKNPPLGQDKAGHFKPTVWQKRHDKWQAGERPWLYVRETWAGEASYDDVPPRDIPDDACCICYDADGAWSDWDEMTHAGRWRPSIHMPKWASRLSLRVTDMRRQRLQDISEEDAVAEGIHLTDHKAYLPPHEQMWAYDGDVYFDRPATAFNHLWREIHGHDSWTANPEVIALTFEVHAQNIERIA